MLEDALHNEYPAWSRDEVAPFLPGDARRVLDVGCGSGGFAKHLRGREAYGLEPNDAAAQLADPHYRTVHRGTFPDAVPAGERFDCIVFNDVLEHLVDPWAAVRTCAELLEPGGSVLASIPNMRYLRVMRRLVLDAQWEYADFGVLDRTHLRWFTHRTMRTLFEDNGFRVERMAPINEDDGWKARVLKSMPSFADMAALQFVVVARPVGR